MNIGWPEGIYIAIVIANLIVAAALDGEPKTGKHKFAVTLLGSSLGLGLLYWGGFFA